MRVIELRDALDAMVKGGLGNIEISIPTIPEVGMSFCSFSGPTPAGYKDWGEFMAAPMKTGVHVRAMTPKDLKKK
jgi:hypothetical protein